MLSHDHFKIPSENGSLGNVEMNKKHDFNPRGTNLQGVNAKSLLTGSMDKFLNVKDESGLFFRLFIGLPLIYGGVHLSAWTFEFPTAVESLLWKVSGITIAAIFPVWLSWLFTVAAIQFVVRSVSGLELDWDEDGRFTKLVDGPVILAFIACRLYIVVEAFVSLRAVPIGVYWTPAWIQMIPHV